METHPSICSDDGVGGQRASIETSNLTPSRLRVLTRFGLLAIVPVTLAAIGYFASIRGYRELSDDFPELNFALGSLEMLYAIQNKPEAWERAPRIRHQLHDYLSSQTELVANDYFATSVQEEFYAVLFDLRETKGDPDPGVAESAKARLLNRFPELYDPYDAITPLGQSSYLFVGSAVLILAILPISAFAFRGGITFRLVEMKVVTEEGNTPSRLHAGWRCTLGVFLFLIILLASLNLAMVIFARERWPGLGWTLAERTAGGAIAMTVTYAFTIVHYVAFRRSLPDRLAGTYVISKKRDGKARS